MMRTRKVRRSSGALGHRFARALALLCAATAVLGIAAGTGLASTPVPQVRTVNFGAGPIKIGGRPLKIAYLDACAVCNAWSVSNSNAAVAQAKKLGVQLTVYDAALDAIKQVDQAKTALSQGYNAMVIIALSPEMCTVAKQAIKKGVLISIVNQHVCTSVYTTGTATWVPGTVNFIGGDQTQNIFTKYLMAIAAANPGPQQVALVVGTPVFAQSQLAAVSTKLVEKKYPGFKVTPIVDATYDITGAFNAVQSYLPANPNLTILATVYSDITQGAVKALQLAKRTNVKVYDMGGSKWAFAAVRAGTLKFTSVFLPATEGVDSVQSLYTAWYTGNPGAHYLNILQGVPNPFVTKQDIGNRKAQY
jgi:ribose transport system substrate-binding protein